MRDFGLRTRLSGFTAVTALMSNLSKKNPALLLREYIENVPLFNDKLFLKIKIGVFCKNVVAVH